MKKIWVGIGCVGVVMVVFLVLSLRGDNKQNDKALITFPNGQTIFVDVADDPSEQAQGLSDLTAPQSMLFLFPTKSIPAFWMKDMFFAIDIIWLDDERIVGFEKNIQPENPAKTFYRPTGPVDGALEVPAGTVNDLALQEGDQLDITWKSP